MCIQRWKRTLSLGMIMKLELEEFVILRATVLTAVRKTFCTRPIQELIGQHHPCSSSMALNTCPSSIWARSFVFTLAQLFPCLHR